jgi:hypothetical protein
MKKTDIEERLSALENTISTLGPLAAAREAEVLRGHTFTGGRLHTVTWTQIGLVPGRSVLLDMERGGDVMELRITPESVHVRFSGGQNVVRAMYVIP